MASRSFQSITYRWSEGLYKVWDETLVTDEAQWFALVNVAEDYEHPLTYQGETYITGWLYAVGKAPLIPPSPGVTSCTFSLVEGSGQYNNAAFDPDAIGQPPMSWQRYGDTDYILYNSAIGSRYYYCFDADYNFANSNDFFAALENGEITPFNTKLTADVYIKGVSEPDIWVKFNSQHLNYDEIPAELVRCIFDESAPVWSQTDLVFAYQDTKTEDDLVVVNTSDWSVHREGIYALGSEYEGSWILMRDAIKSNTTDSQAAIGWNNYEVKPPEISLLIQFAYEETSDYIYRVVIPRQNITSLSSITVSPIGGSKKGEPPFLTEIIIHLQAPSDSILPDEQKYPEGTNADGTESGIYTPDTFDPSVFEDGAAAGFDGTNVLTKTYAVNEATLENIGQKLWSQSYFDVLKIQSNPIQNIISVKWLPFSQSGTSESIMVGDVDFEVNGDTIPSMKRFQVGTGIKWTGIFDSFLDFAPYTVIKIYLPYVGMAQLDPSLIYNRELKVFYVVDMITGDCMAQIEGDSVPILNLKGRIGVDIPLTSSDRVQTELKSISNTINTAASVAGSIMKDDYVGAVSKGATGALSIAGMEVTSQRSGSVSSACGAFENRTVFLQIEQPLLAWPDGDSKGYGHVRGYPCHKYLQLKDLTGYVEVDNTTDINIAMTSEENRMLEQLLTGGIYI